MNPNKTRDFTPPFSQDLAGTTPFTKKPRRAVTWRSGSMAACTTCVPASSSRAGNLTTGVPLKFMEFMEPIGVPPGRTPRKPFRKPDRIGAWRLVSSKPMFLFQKLRDSSWEKFGMPFWPECRVNMEELFFCGQQPEENKWECSNVCSFETSSSSQ